MLFNSLCAQEAIFDITLSLEALLETCNVHG